MKRTGKSVQTMKHDNYYVIKAVLYERFQYAKNNLTFGTDIHRKFHKYFAIYTHQITILGKIIVAIIEIFLFF